MPLEAQARSIARADRRDLPNKNSLRAANPGARGAVIELSYGIRPPHQHRALIDVALVGDFTAVNGSGFREQQGPRGVARRMARLRLEFRQSLSDGGANFVMADHFSNRGAFGQARMRATCRDVREDEEAHLAAVMAGNDDVLRERCERGDAGDTQHADADPG